MRWCFALVAFLLLSCAHVKQTEKKVAQPNNEVKLVLFLTIDQLRGDMLDRFQKHFGSDGLRRLMNEGTFYENAHFQHSTTFTAVGHATLVTGGNAPEHGLAANDWYDRKKAQRVYCVEDEGSEILGAQTKAHAGTSPKNLISSTIGDELVAASGGRSRVFSVSVKDRGAIIPGGKKGKAFWYSKSTGEFVTSSYYYPEYPQWVADWNAKKLALSYRSLAWNLSRARDHYRYGKKDARTFEKGTQLGTLGNTFPHRLQEMDAKKFYGVLRYTPMADELTLLFAKALIHNEKLGQKKQPDMLAISFSATDYIGHAFGPNSLEYEDNLIRLDRTINHLLRYVDQKVGLKNTLVVLSSDHGVDEIPEARLAGKRGGGRLDPHRFLPPINRRLKKRFKVSGDIVAAFWNPGVFLNEETIQKNRLNRNAVEKALAGELRRVPGIELAIPKTQLLVSSVGGPLMKKVRAGVHPERSGDVVIIQKKGWYLYHDAHKFAAMHGSPYPYDTHVPILLMGPGIPKKRIKRVVAPRDLAPTLAVYLGVNKPTGSIGNSLGEIVGKSDLLE